MNTIGQGIRILSATVALIAAAATFSESTFGMSCPAANTVRNAGSAFIGAARQRSPTAFASALARYADVNAIAIFALGQYRNALPAAQRSGYVTNTHRYMSRILADNAGSFGDSANLTIEACTGNQVETSLNGRSRMLWRVSGGRIRDVRVSGVWLTLQLRSKFTGIVRRNHGEVGALVDYLAK